MTLCFCSMQEDLQRRVASAIASAEDAMATMTPSKSADGEQQQEEEQEALSPTSPGSPAGLDLAEPLAGSGGDPLSMDELLSPTALSDAGSTSSPAAAELSLASILGEGFGGPAAAGDDELELTDVGSGETVAVESMGVNAADLQALIDGV